MLCVWLTLFTALSFTSGATNTTTTTTTTPTKSSTSINNTTAITTTRTTRTSPITTTAAATTSPTTTTTTTTIPTTTTTSSTKWKDFCDRYGFGTYCKDDLSGYIKCGGSSWWGDYQVVENVDCDKDNRCSCFLGNDCEMPDPHELVGVEKGGICQPYHPVLPIKEVLHLYYNKTGWEEVDPNEDEVHHDVTGEWKQDTRRQSSMHIWTDKVKMERFFELVIPDGGGAFWKFSGQYPDHCTKTSTKKFNGIADEIRYFRQRTSKSRKVSESFEEQEWYHMNLDSMFETGSPKTWTVLADLKEQNITPLKYVDITTDEWCCWANIKTFYKEVEVDMSTDLDAWFQVPAFCPY